jgi:hypothetical protein
LVSPLQLAMQAAAVAAAAQISAKFFGYCGQAG